MKVFVLAEIDTPNGKVKFEEHQDGSSTKWYIHWPGHVAHHGYSMDKAIECFSEILRDTCVNR